MNLQTYLCSFLINNNAGMPITVSETEKSWEYSCFKLESWHWENECFDEAIGNIMSTEEEITLLANTVSAWGVINLQAFPKSNNEPTAFWWGNNSLEYISGSRHERKSLSGINRFITWTSIDRLLFPRSPLYRSKLKHQNPCNRP